MPSLHKNENIVAQVRTLVEHHRQYKENPLLFACWHHLEDEKDVWLLEIAENVADPGEGNIVAPCEVFSTVRDARAPDAVKTVTALFRAMKQLETRFVDILP